MTASDNAQAFQTKVENGGTANIGNNSIIEHLVQIFHLAPQEILSLESFWENWSQDTEPPLSPSLVVGGREEARDRLLSWLRGNPSPLTLQGDSPEEAIAFLAAVIRSLDDEERTRVLPKAIVVDGATAWQNLITSADPLILIARLSQPEGVGQAIKRGHHVFIPAGHIGEADVALSRIVRDAAKQALEGMGLSNERSRDLATLARRSLPALWRKLAIAKGVRQPAWAQPNVARQLLAPLLAGAWNNANSCEGDRNALGQLSGMPYEQLEPILVRWANEPDPPLRRVGNTWMIAVQEDAWRLIARYLTDEDLRRFERVAIDVLSELNPAFELPPEQRYLANIYGKVLTRSGRLRESVAETLALMAALSSEIPFITNRTGEQVAHHIVWQLLEQAKDNATLWASLAYQLPLLAEAAPGIFLKAVEISLTGENPILSNLFQDKISNAALMGSSPYTRLLWALETLAWNPDHLSSAALNLARLARLDPGGTFANRPMRSLRDIFICWHPNTATPLNRRLRVLDTIRKKEPDVAWHLLMQLLPRHHSTVSPTHRTKWGDWVPDPRPTPTVQEYVDATNAILESLLSDAKTNPVRWCNLISAVRGMARKQQEKLLQTLEALDPGVFEAEERAQIWNCLREETVSHRDFASASWALPVEHVQRMEEISDRFEPEDLIARYRSLFGRGALVKSPGIRRLAWNEQEEIIEDWRTQALQAVIADRGWSGVLELAEQVQEPRWLGSTLARSNLLPIDLGAFLQANLGAPEFWRNQMAQSFVTVCAYSQGEQWIEDCLSAHSETWNPDQYGEFLLCLPFSVSLLDRLDTASEEIQRYFWSRVQHVTFLDETHADRVLTNLLKFARPHVAISPLQWANEQTPGIVSSERIAEILEVSVRTLPVSGFDISQFAYVSAELLDYLEKTDLPRDRLAQLEWLYLQLHDDYRHPQTLHEELAQNPEFFIEVLQFAYRAKNESQLELTEEAIAIAHLAHDLLDSWRKMPGVQADGSVDTEALHNWVMRVRELAAACDCSEIADIHIGHILAFSSVDLDGAWPHQSVRDLIEELENPEIETGWRTQIFNNRGVTVRDPTDGGKQELLLADKYEQYARQVGEQWSRTAIVLREIADQYRHQAVQEDQQADLTQDFW